MAVSNVVASLLGWLRADQPPGPGYVPLLALLDPRAPEAGVAATVDAARARAIDRDDVVELSVVMLEVTGNLATPRDLSRVRSRLPLP